MNETESYPASDVNRAVFKSLQGLRRRGVVRKVGPRYRCSYALAVSA